MEQSGITSFFFVDTLHRSRVYRWQNGILNEHQQLDTMGAADVETVMIGTNYFLVVANSRNDGKPATVLVKLLWPLVGGNYNGMYGKGGDGGI